MKSNNLKILVLGATGNLGFAVSNFLNTKKNLKISICLRQKKHESFFPYFNKNQFYIKKNINETSIRDVIQKSKPDIIINCIGVIKPRIASELDIKDTVFINSYLPHILANLTSDFNFRLIHFSTDCVFSGKKGNYKEKDFPDPIDMYGLSKMLGEVKANKNCITLRTSLIGHEINSNYSLLNWFLTQKNVKGFSDAYFSGLTTLEIAKVLYRNIIFKKKLFGLYHLASKRISKYSLLKLINKIYKKNILISEDKGFKIDRSLSSARLSQSASYKIKPWKSMLTEQYNFYLSHPFKK